MWILSLIRKKYKKWFNNKLLDLKKTENLITKPSKVNQNDSMTRVPLSASYFFHHQNIWMAYSKGIIPWAWKAHGLDRYSNILMMFFVLMTGDTWISSKFKYHSIWISHLKKKGAKGSMGIMKRALSFFIKEKPLIFPALKWAHSIENAMESPQKSMAFIRPKNRQENKHWKTNNFIEIINLQTINFNSFHINFFNQVYFYKAVLATNLGGSTDITQGVPLLRRYFDVPKNSLFHLFLKQIFENYKMYIGNTKNQNQSFLNFSFNIQNSNFIPSYSTIYLPNKKRIDLIQIIPGFLQDKITGQISTDLITKKKKIKTLEKKKKISSKINKNLEKNVLNKFKISSLHKIILKYSLVKILQKIVNNVQAVYRGQGVEIYDQHIEVLICQMGSKIRIKEKFHSKFFWNEIVPLSLIKDNTEIEYEPILSGITKISLQSDSFISAASFQNTAKILSRESLKKSKDFLFGLKESIIVNELIPSGTGILITS